MAQRLEMWKSAKTSTTSTSVLKPNLVGSKINDTSVNKESATAPQRHNSVGSYRNSATTALRSPMSDPKHESSLIISKTTTVSLRKNEVCKNKRKSMFILPSATEIKSPSNDHSISPRLLSTKSPNNSRIIVDSQNLDPNIKINNRLFVKGMTESFSNISISEYATKTNTTDSPDCDRWSQSDFEVENNKSSFSQTRMNISSPAFFENLSPSPRLRSPPGLPNVTIPSFSVSLDFPSSDLLLITPMIQTPPRNNLCRQNSGSEKILRLQDKALIDSLKCELGNAQNIAAMSNEEIQELRFVCSIQEQKIEQLENESSKNRIEQQETLTGRSKKYKSEISRLQKEKVEYEERANAMVHQMTDQMSKLQQMAMTRIEILEKEIIKERRMCEELQQENANLKQSVAKIKAASKRSSSSSSDVFLHSRNILGMNADDLALANADFAANMRKPKGHNSQSSTSHCHSSSASRSNRRTSSMFLSLGQESDNNILGSSKNKKLKMLRYENDAGADADGSSCISEEGDGDGEDTELEENGEDSIETIETTAED